MPKDMEYGAEIKVIKKLDMHLFSADWMPERAVAVGRGNS
jgi:hypothetical protein